MNRDEVLRTIQQNHEPWDLLVIGGGASGLGAAVDAASRGYRTLLLEQHDFAKATSSRSTKLVHGGVRYLKYGNLLLVFESLRERGRLLRNAPHIVHRQSFVVPAYGRWESFYYGAGLKFYELLSGRFSLGRSSAISRADILRELPTIRTQGLRGGVQYFDGQFDDARLAICLAQTLAGLGGTALNYARVIRLSKENGRIRGVVAQDAESGVEFEARARVVVNATGVFTDSVRRLDDPHAATLVTKSQGAHIVMDRAFLPGKSALMVPKTADGRVLFAIPWNGRVVIGTTDSPVNDTPLEPRPLADEIEFLLEHAARYLSRPPGAGHVLSVFAGLRPLVRARATRNTARLSRNHTIVVSLSGLVTITGGKWTTYRKMGEDTVDKAAAVGGLEQRPSATRRLRLHGCNAQPGEQSPEIDSDEASDTPRHWRTYGSDADRIRMLARQNPAWNAPLHARLPYRIAEVIWAVRHEMARTVEDVLARRTRSLILDARAAVEAAPGVAALMAAELGRDGDWQRKQVSSFTELARGYRWE